MRSHAGGTVARAASTGPGLSAELAAASCPFRHAPAHLLRVTTCRAETGRTGSESSREQLRTAHVRPSLDAKEDQHSVAGSRHAAFQAAAGSRGRLAAPPRVHALPVRRDDGAAVSGRARHAAPRAAGAMRQAA
eukprot:354857-Chlamydomonas_euryale.AAC.3